MKTLKAVALLALCLASAAVLAGCSTTRSHRSSSVVGYLYPDEREHVETPSVPRLAIPLDVGIAFVPATGGQIEDLSETDKRDLMMSVSDQFADLNFVKSIEIIPSTYLRPKGSFQNLDQIRTMYGIDVIALVAYDHTGFTDEGFSSITYWTLIGPYVFPTQKHEAHTMLDVAVYDIPSRTMLFRAPGMSKVMSRSTVVKEDEQRRDDTVKGFRLAAEELSKNLAAEIELFKKKVKERPDDYEIAYKDGYVGAGSMDAISAALGVALCILRWAMHLMPGKSRDA